MKFDLNGMWLTLNRFCNFRCPWCYAESTNYNKNNDMPLQLAKDIIKLGANLGIKEVMLIGGEPTYYPNLFEVLDCISEHGMMSTLVTNGYRFSEPHFLKKIEESKLDSIGFSLKGGTAEQYAESTKVKDSYGKTKRAIKNLSTLEKIRVGYSVVLSTENLENLEEIAGLVASDPTNWLLLSFCCPTISNEAEVITEHMPTQLEVIQTIVDKLPALKRILNDQFIIEQAFPSCLWPKDILDDLIQSNKIRFGCHVQGRSGLIFDEKGKLIVCNSLPNFKIGQFGKDFTTVDEFNRLWDSEDINNLYKKFREYPVKKCVDCADNKNCSGGCPLHWLTYDAKKVLA